MRRSLAALALAAAVACDGSERQACPGEPVATLQFEGPRVRLGDAALAGLDPEPEVADCSDGAGGTPDVGYPEELPRFEATLSAAGAQTVALCERDGVVLFGIRTATGFFVETGTTGAALGACSATCSAHMRYVVTGNVSGGGAEPLAFRGLLVEVLTQVAGECGDCLPAVPGTEPAVHACAARYAVTGTP